MKLLALKAQEIAIGNVNERKFESVSDAIHFLLENRSKMRLREAFWVVKNLPVGAFLLFFGISLSLSLVVLEMRGIAGNLISFVSPETSIIGEYVDTSQDSTVSDFLRFSGREDVPPNVSILRLSNIEGKRVHKVRVFCSRTDVVRASLLTGSVGNGFKLVSAIPNDDGFLFVASRADEIESAYVLLSTRGKAPKKEDIRIMAR